MAHTCSACGLICLLFLFLNEFIALGVKRSRNCTEVSRRADLWTNDCAYTAALWLGTSAKCQLRQNGSSCDDWLSFSVLVVMGQQGGLCWKDMCQEGWFKPTLQNDVLKMSS